MSVLFHLLSRMVSDLTGCGLGESKFLANWLKA